MRKRSKMTVKELAEIKVLLKMGSTVRVLSETFGRSKKTIENIKFLKSWKETEA